jgi:hypothetical protein
MFRSFVNVQSVAGVPLWFIAGIDTTTASKNVFRSALTVQMFIPL